MGIDLDIWMVTASVSPRLDDYLLYHLRTRSFFSKKCSRRLCFHQILGLYHTGPQQPSLYRPKCEVPVAKQARLSGHASLLLIGDLTVPRKAAMLTLYAAVRKTCWIAIT